MQTFFLFCNPFAYSITPWILSHFLTFWKLGWWNGASRKCSSFFSSTASFLYNSATEYRVNESVQSFMGKFYECPCYRSFCWEPVKVRLSLIWFLIARWHQKQARLKIKMNCFVIMSEKRLNLNNTHMI